MKRSCSSGSLALSNWAYILSAGEKRSLRGDLSSVVLGLRRCWCLSLSI
jgi:hypothetical protein